MSGPRYTIIRVDNNWCPSTLDDVDMEIICTNKTNIKNEKIVKAADMATRKSS